MVDLHSRLAYFTSLVRQTSVHNMVDSFYFTWVDSHQTSVYTQQTRIFYFTCSLDICSQYGRAFCSLLVLAYFTSLGQTRIRDMFTIWQTCTYFTSLLRQTSVHNMVDSFYFTWVDSNQTSVYALQTAHFTSLVHQTSVHNMVDSFYLWQTRFTSLGQTRIRHLFTKYGRHFCSLLALIYFTSLVLLHLGRLALDICSQYGRLFCSLLGQTRIKHLFTIWQTHTVDLHILLHL